MDVWSALAGRMGLVVKPSSALLGRWMSHFRSGKFVHQDIRNAMQHRLETQIGAITHYVIGALLGVVFLVLADTTSFNPKNYVAAAAYGLLTCVFAWFLMFPAFGFGVFGSNAPAEAKLLRTSTMNHIVFGLTLGVVFNLLQ